MEELGEILANSGNVEAEVEAEELAREISRFVQGLSARKRTIFIRRYFNVESLEQIASDLRTTPNSVSATLSIIRKKLRRYLSERDYL